jgi:hypothetical protein
MLCLGKILAGRMAAVAQAKQSVVGRMRERFATAMGWDSTRLLSVEEQTKLSWARLVKAPEDIPEAFREFFDRLTPAEREPFPYAVLTPTYKGFLNPEKEKLICRIGGSLCVLMMTENRLVATEYPFAAISYLETGTILLSSWLTIRGADARGNSASATLKFNSVTEHLFAPFVDGFRSFAAGDAEKSAADAETPQFESLRDANFKFMNYARRTVRPGEKVVQTVLQPELRKKYFRWPALPFSRQITPAHLSLLTESELILIRDDETQHSPKGRPYGGIWRYIPLRQISSVSLFSPEDDLWALSLRLSKNQQLESLFHESKKKEIQLLQGQIRQRSALQPFGNPA